MLGYRETVIGVLKFIGSLTIFRYYRQRSLTILSIVTIQRGSSYNLILVTISLECFAISLEHIALQRIMDEARIANALFKSMISIR